jgi:hypothetical protein
VHYCTCELKRPDKIVVVSSTDPPYDHNSDEISALPLVSTTPTLLMIRRADVL